MNGKIVPQFFIDKKDWDKIIKYAESSYRQFKAEIGGQCVVIEDKDGDFWLTEPVIMKQEVSGANCELDETALAIHYSKMAGKYGDKVRHCWWHSHHTMGAFWSGTDTSTIKENVTEDFSVSLVVNLAEEYKLRVQMFYPIEAEFDVKLNIHHQDVKTSDKIDKEVKDNCEKETSAITTYIGGNRTYHYNNNQQEIWDYNRGFSVSAVDFDKLEPDQYIQLMQWIDELSTKFYNAQIDYQAYKKEVKSANKKLKKHNLRVKNLKSHQLATFAMGNFAEDFFENIKEEAKA